MRTCLATAMETMMTLVLMRSAIIMAILDITQHAFTNMKHRTMEAHSG